MKSFSFIFFLFFSLSMVSCVQSVEDGELDENISNEIPDKEVNYAGISNAIAISDSKVEVYFPPFPTDNQADITYILSYDGSSSRTYLSGRDLIPDVGTGLYLYVFKNLDINSEYSFNVEVKDKNDDFSKSLKKIKAKTFVNKTADFLGITKASNLVGASGKTGIHVEWIEAPTTGSLISKDEGDPVNYIVTILNASVYKVSEIDNKSISGLLRKEVIVAGDKRSTQINGLEPGQEYFVRVRSTHYGFQENSFVPGYEREKNNIILKVKTFNESNGINLVNDSLRLDIPSDYTSFNSIIASWTSAEGVFDHYRLYYSKTQTDLLNIGNSSDCFNSGVVYISGTVTTVGCDKIDQSLSQYTVNGLEHLSNYYFILVACGDHFCSSSLSRSTNITLIDRSSTNIVEFTGISKINNPTSLSNLDEISLIFDNPSLSSGNFSGIDFFLFPSESSSFDDSTIIDDSSGESGLSINPFNYLFDTEVKIRGVSIGNRFCFQAYPYLLNDSDNPEVKTYYYTDTLRPVCKSLEIEEPISQDFFGFKPSSFNCFSDSISFSWEKPSKGIYSSFFLVIYSGSKIVLEDAIASEPGYSIIFPSVTSSEIFINGLDPGDYSFRLRSYYIDSDGTEYFGIPENGDLACTL